MKRLPTNPPANSLPERGVYEREFAAVGRKAFDIVDRAGKLLASIEVDESLCDPIFIQRLWSLLESFDPPRHLTDGLPRDAYLTLS